MNKLIFILTIMCSHFAYGQKIYTCIDGNTKFTSDAPLEVIVAQSNKTVGVIDVSLKNVAFSVVIQTFNGFKSSLQKEHFNENYLETNKYNTATFKGKIIEDVDLTANGTYLVRAKGMFNIHGVEKEKIVKTKIIVKDQQISIDALFDVPLEDFNIKIPRIVNQKIASIIYVVVKAVLKPKA
jgi:polyisoprenoid-binding protein YceI